MPPAIDEQLTREGLAVNVVRQGPVRILVRRR